jgi:hypothetical protein
MNKEGLTSLTNFYPLAVPANFVNYTTQNQAQHHLETVTIAFPPNPLFHQLCVTVSNPLFYRLQVGVGRKHFAYDKFARDILSKGPPHPPLLQHHSPFPPSSLPPHLYISIAHRLLIPPQSCAHTLFVSPVFPFPLLRPTIMHIFLHYPHLFLEMPRA